MPRRRSTCGCVPPQPAPSTSTGTSPWCAGSPAWHRLAELVYRYGEHFYNFEGLRDFKQKFDPQWESRYLACPGGLALPAVLRDVTTLVAGGVRGVLAK